MDESPVQLRSVSKRGRTCVRYLFIGGRQLPLVSRDTMLNDEFKDRK